VSPPSAPEPSAARAADSARRPRSLTWASELDLLALDAEVERREDGYLVVRSPTNPGYYWGNLLLLDTAPRAGDGERWEALFEAEFGADPRVRHRTFAWDRSDGELGAALEEFAPRGYVLEQTVGMLAPPWEVRAHPRANRDVVVRALEHTPGADAELWAQVVELQVAGRDERFPEDVHREFRRKRLDELRALFAARGGGWYVALGRHEREVLASGGVVARERLATIIDVDTAKAHRRRGICSRLLVDAVADVAREQPVERVVIGADPDYHALGLYESLGFTAVERVAGVCRQPPAES